MRCPFQGRRCSTLKSSGTCLTSSLVGDIGGEMPEGRGRWRDKGGERGTGNEGRSYCHLPLCMAPTLSPSDYFSDRFFDEQPIGYLFSRLMHDPLPRKTVRALRAEMTWIGMPIASSNSTTASPGVCMGLWRRQGECSDEEPLDAPAGTASVPGSQSVEWLQESAVNIPHSYHPFFHDDFSLYFRRHAHENGDARSRDEVAFVGSSRYEDDVG